MGQQLSSGRGPAWESGVEWGGPGTTKIVREYIVCWSGLMFSKLKFTSIKDYLAYTQQGKGTMRRPREGPCPRAIAVGMSNAARAKITRTQAWPNTPAFWL